MSKKKTKNKRNSELKIIFFIILVAAAVFIVSTYAWFTTQRNVSITNLSGTVEVAEGLEISLDALTWANEIVLSDEVTIINSAYEKHRNISPVEMLPVSTTGILSSTTETDLTMIRGKVTNSIKLSEIVAMDEALAVDPDQTTHKSENAQYPGYFAFDIFLKNSSKQTVDADPLQLNYDSSVHIIEDGNSEVGLQNTVRVALARYGSEYKNGAWQGVASVMADQTTVLQKTGAVDSGDDVYLTEVAIWEPNSSDHVEYIVTNNNKITWGSGSSLYGKLFTTTTQMPTYAVKEDVLDVTDAVIEDIYLWDGTEDYLEEQNVLQTTNQKDDQGVVTSYDIKEGVQHLICTDDGTNFSIAPNSIVRLRVYVWLEGQDVDCINYASYGGGVTVNLGLVKGSKVGTTAEDVEE